MNPKKTKKPIEPKASLESWGKPALIPQTTPTIAPKNRKAKRYSLKVFGLIILPPKPRLRLLWLECVSFAFSFQFFTRLAAVFR